MPSKLMIDDILSNFLEPKLLSDEGGQKIVFTVKLKEGGEPVVLKIGTFESRSSLDRIAREVDILRNIHSKYFPKNIAFEMVGDNRYFIIEEYLHGSTLKDCISNYPSEKLALSLIKELVIALQIPWSMRIVHRDLKPQNIIITSDGPRVIDFGIARVLDSTSLTNTFAQFGPRTPAYASPEQIENRKRDIDFRSDQFNLGIIFAQLLLAGDHPFHPDIVGNRSGMLENILADNWAKDRVETVSSPPTLAVVSRMLGHEPFQRYRKAEDLYSALNHLSGG